MNWNPANWRVTDTLQGQETGYSPASIIRNTAGKAIAGAGSLVGAPEYGVSESIRGQAQPSVTIKEQIQNADNKDSRYQQAADETVQQGDVLGASTSAGANQTAAQQQANQQAQQNAARQAAIQASQEGYRSSAQTGLRDVKNEYGMKSRNFVDNLRESQQGLNQGFANNQLDLRRSMQNIVRGVRQGVRSGGVALAGMNAFDSGATDALARAYAQVGNQQTGEAQGQFTTQQEELMRQQGQLRKERQDGVSDLDTWADTEVNRVQNDLSNKLAVLSANAQAQGLDPSMVDQGMVDQVIGEALDQLASIDQTRKQNLQGVQRWDNDRIMQEAIRLDEAGQAGNIFDVTSPNVNFGGGGGQMPGAPIGQLPIYTRQNRDEDNRVVAPARGNDEEQRR